MNTALKIGLGITLAAAIGGGVFFFTRGAAAASSAKQAFKVTGCKKIELLDADAAEQAITAAAIASFRGMDEPAAALLDRVVGTMFPDCPDLANEGSVVVPGATMFPGIPSEFAGKEVPLSVLKLLLVGQSVADVKKALEKAGKVTTALGGAAEIARSTTNVAEILVPLFFAGWQPPSDPGLSM